MRIVVTGAAGFIGSHLSERLIEGGATVVGVDCFTDFYAPAIKQGNIAGLLADPSFELVTRDLAEDPLDDVLEGADGVVHLAAQAGVRGSFGGGFDVYVRNNVLATQRLFEAAADAGVTRVVYASSSSVYGTASTFPTTELSPRMPVSPYGMTKAATEDLAAVYQRTRGLEPIGLRYFTAFGPRQRPDMAFSRFFVRALTGEPIPVYGTGRQIRDFTYVDDIVAGTIAALDRGVAGRAYNLGGGTPTALIDVIETIGELVGEEPRLTYHDAPLGEADRTGADCELAESELGWTPAFSLREGLEAQLEWVREGLERGADAGRLKLVA